MSAMEGLTTQNPKKSSLNVDFQVNMKTVESHQGSTTQLKKSDSVVQSSLKVKASAPIHDSTSKTSNSLTKIVATSEKIASATQIDASPEMIESSTKIDHQPEINKSSPRVDSKSELNDSKTKIDSTPSLKQSSVDLDLGMNPDLEPSTDAPHNKRARKHLSQVILPHLATALYDSKLVERTTKRVLAPYIRSAKHYQPSPQAPQDMTSAALKLTPTSKVKASRRKPDTLTRNLAAYLNGIVDITTLLHETADVLQLVTKSDGVTLYMINTEAGEIYNQPKNVLSARPKGKWKMKPAHSMVPALILVNKLSDVLLAEKTTVAAFVALHKEYLVVEDLPNETRFPEGLGWIDSSIRAVLCVPVVTPDDELIALIELYKEQIRYENDVPFERVDLQIVVTVTGWMGAAIHQNQQRLALQLSQELNDTLLEMTRKYFSDLVSIDKMITAIVLHAKAMIGAERGAFFIVERDVDQLVADLYEEAIDNVKGDHLLLKKKIKIRFDKHRGISGTAAATGEPVNVHNAYDDPRFNPEVDILTGVTTRSVLCSPFKGSEGVIGMIQLVNKIDGPHFTLTDEKTLSSYIVYCTLSLNYYQMQKNSRHARMVDAVESEMLAMHFKPCIHDRNRMFQAPLMDEIPFGFNKFAWYLTGFEEHMAQLVYFMITDMAPDIFDEKILCMFILTVKKGYRKNPYHNYDHAFNVAHCMYNILKRNQDIFTPLENKALVIAALCHDIDHRGFTNNFMQQINAELIQLYPESCMENHHFQTTMRILQSTKLFNHVTPGEYKDIVDEIHDAIIATDLALYFRCRPRLISLMVNNEFDWTVNNHRVLVKSIIMTTCDLSGQAKPFPVAKRITESLYREFYHQGDLEKEMGLVPLSMMDREKQHTIPTDQKRFIDIVVLPCVELLSKVLPNTVELYNLSRDLRNHWDEIIELRVKTEKAAKTGLL